MTRRAALLCSLSALFLVVPGARGAPVPGAFVAPNIVIVVLDDPNPAHLGLAGYPISVTPHLDLLAEGGIVFRNVQTNPRCAPSVAQLLSGRECLSNGICWNKGAPAVPAQILPKVLRDGPEGYHAFGQGKGVVRDEDIAFEHGLHDPDLWRDPVLPAWTDQMTAFLNATNDGAPRFLWVMPTLPHVPWTPPYSTAEDLKPLLPVPDGVSLEDREAFLVAEEQQVKMTEYTDARLGEFLCAVEDRFEDDPLRDTWVVVIVGDNGFANGRIGKGSPYDAGVRSWAIWKSLQDPLASTLSYDLPISTLDVARTVLRLGRASEPSYRGEDLFPLLRGTKTPLEWVASVGRDTVYNAVFPDEQTIVSCLPAEPSQDVYALYGHHIDAAGQRWKYVIWQREVREEEFFFPPVTCPPLPPWLDTSEIGLHHDFVAFGQRTTFTEELYRLDLDPEEQSNLACVYPTLLADLRAGAYQWWLDAGGGQLPGP